MTTNVFSAAADATSAVFNAVGDSATAITKGITGISVAGTTFERFMLDMDQDHADRSAIHRSSYRASLIQDTAMSMAKEQEELQQELSRNPHFKNLFAENYETLNALFDAPKA